MGKTGNTIKDLLERVSKLESLVKTLQSDADHCMLSSKLIGESFLVLQDDLKDLREDFKEH